MNKNREQKREGEEKREIRFKIMLHTQLPVLNFILWSIKNEEKYIKTKNDKITKCNRSK